MHDPGMRHGGAGATAADFPPTARSLKMIMVWCVSVMAAAPVLAALVLWFLIAGADSGSGGSSGAGYAGILGAGLPIAAGVWLGYRRRMIAALRRGPWTACRATTVTSGVNNPTVVVQDPATGELRVFTARTALWFVDMADAGPGGVLWWCEGTKGDGVVARPGGSGLVWVKPARSRRKREAGLAQAARSGLVQPPPGPQHQAWGGPQHPAQHPPQQQSGWGPQPGPPPQGWGQQQPQGPPPGPYPGTYPGQAPGPHSGQAPGPYPGQ